MALKDNLISHWALDEASGNALDSHGANELADNNTVGAAVGKIVGSRDFENGSAERFTLADNADLSFADDAFHFAGWVQLESVGANRAIIEKGTGSHGEYELYYVQASTQFRLDVYSSTGFGGGHTVLASSFGTPSLATWYFLECWHDPVANEIGIRVNRGTANTTSHSTGILDGAGGFKLGSDSFANHFDGLMEGWSLWSVKKSDADMDAIYNAGAGLAFADWDAGGGSSVVPALDEGMLVGGLQSLSGGLH